MENSFHHVRFETKSNCTRVFIDDKELKGCYRAEFKWSATGIPVINLDIMAFDITVDIDNASVNEVKP